jgi:hypothetical protein
MLLEATRSVVAVAVKATQLVALVAQEVGAMVLFVQALEQTEPPTLAAAVGPVVQLRATAARES